MIKKQIVTHCLYLNTKTYNFLLMHVSWIEFWNYQKYISVFFISFDVKISFWMCYMLWKLTMLTGLLLVLKVINTVNSWCKKVYFSFLKSRVVWFKEDLCYESKNQLSEKNALCRWICNLRSFLNREFTVLWDFFKFLWTSQNIWTLLMENFLSN